MKIPRTQKNLSMPPVTIPAKSPVNTSYDKDFYKWTSDQASLLKKGEFSKLDIINLIEEIESLGRSEKRTLKSYLRNALLHMLKAKYQPERHTKSWDASIQFSMFEAKECIKENPSMKTKLKEIFNTAYKEARYGASIETGIELKVFPKESPWNLNDILQIK
jgi:hypothetical protein